MISLSAYTLTTQFRPALKTINTPLPATILEPAAQRLSAEDQELRDEQLTLMWHRGEPADRIQTALRFKTRQGVYTAAYRLKLPKRKIIRINKAKSAEDDQIIRDYWPRKQVELKQIADILGWKYPQSVSKRAKEIGLPNRRTWQSRSI